MKYRVALLAVALAAAPSSADIQYVDNSSGQFQWNESFDLNGTFRHGTSLDVTLGASQSGQASLQTLMSYSEIFFTSNQLVTTSIRPDTPGVATVARGDGVFLDFGPWSGTVFPAIAFAASVPIGIDAGGGSWEPDADIDYRSGQNSGSLIGGRAFIGIRLQLADGIHYGWIDLRDDGYNGGPSLVPLAWAWETEVDVPIAAGAVPAPASAMILGAALLPLCRRRAR